MKTSASEAVQAWLQSLPPSTKHRVRMALRGLAEESGDIKALHGPLDGFYRLRVGGYRIIFSHQPGPMIRMEYADLRDVVYEAYKAILDAREGR